MRKVEELGLTKEYETTNQLASLQTLSLLNDSSGHQFTKKRKIPSPKRKSAEYYARLRRELICIPFALWLNICSFVLCIYFKVKYFFLS